MQLLQLPLLFGRRLRHIDHCDATVVKKTSELRGVHSQAYARPCLSIFRTDKSINAGGIAPSLVSGQFGYQRLSRLLRFEAAFFVGVGAYLRTSLSDACGK